METQPTFTLATLRQQLEAYLEIQTASGHSTRTPETYREWLTPFVDWCEMRAVYHAPQVSLPLLESWQRYLRRYRKADGQHYGNNSQLQRLRCLRGWFRWLLQRHHILYNPADMLILPKEEQRLPAQVLSDVETEQVLNSLDTQTPLGLRNRAVLEALWSTGIRRTELINLRLGDIDRHRGVVVVRQGKNGHDRVVPIGERALAWLERYLADVRPQLAYRYDSGYVFITVRGNPLSRNTLTQMAGHTIREEAKLDKAGSCHVFRHSMATQMLENGADTRHIQAILGHKKLETTQIYTRVAIGHLKEVHEQTHPAERKPKKQKTPPDNRQTESAKPDSKQPN
ncbi:MULTISPECIES: site-specific tyrosine recombinase XerC [Photorhabdus]|uniref:Phage integrase n=2 Tax=Photorhabdus asymbiotica TaxID=291112 RepID=B6VMR6_PHOAA|nr:site-specific tyrosine recombinase XerC [Photorhabdus asymbiotica]CAR67446.1 probable integrase/recombinase [Photorhabdus asymbiotica subsp. asymbiotica ATCC 43949]RKS54143.1 integrase/recombinase XerD [Photorhabdus asymbiotica]RKS57657.1 integrase/recombinase XerD [Photorhabdus asymbiotica]RKS66976.1 integrase/recombinase XerD [Photorhabdus asymbiotica]CAQ83032.1 putative phage integrase/recombinase [Photorhabdus asymbiotica]